MLRTMPTSSGVIFYLFNESDHEFFMNKKQIERGRYRLKRESCYSFARMTCKGMEFDSQNCILPIIFRTNSIRFQIVILSRMFLKNLLKRLRQP